MVSAEVKCGRLDTAFLVLERMSASGVKPGLAAYTSILAGIFHHASNERRFEQANEVSLYFKAMEQHPPVFFRKPIKCV